MPAPLNILHMHSSFDLGGKESRAVQLMNACGDRARHTIVSGMPDQVSARDAIAKGVVYEIAQNPPPLTGRPSVGRFEAIAKYMRRFDLVLSYNWGAIDAVMAKRAFPKGAPPFVHHEDGFNADEAEMLIARRTVYRRLAFAAAQAVVVPSVTLEYIAQQSWKLSAPQLRRIPNGIATALYARQPDPKAIPGFARKSGEVVVGAIAGLRAVKNLPALVRAVGGCSAKIRLVIVGEGPERALIERTAANMGLSDQLVMPGFLPEPYRYVGDMLHMVSYENRPCIDQYRNEVGLRDVIQGLAQNPAGRAALGKANRAKAVAEYDEKVMIEAYRSLYEEAAGHPGALT